MMLALDDQVIQLIHTCWLALLSTLSAMFMAWLTHRQRQCERRQQEERDKQDHEPPKEQ